MDVNGNGSLSLAEIDKAVIELYPQFNNKPALMRAYKSADKSGNGFIGRKEFRLLVSYLVYFNGLWEKFEEIDSSGDRRLTLQEFVRGTAVLELPVSKAEATVSSRGEHAGSPPYCLTGRSVSVDTPLLYDATVHTQCAVIPRFTPAILGG
jgi:hypothetical protein